MRTSEIAKRYLDYFAAHDHLVVPSASLISPNPTTLFTIAGMVPFIPYLMGEQTAPHPRMASNQKCVRTLDIDEVGKTTRHGTFFQMLGNFSFGDYFKEEAIHYAYELLTTPQDKGGYGFDPEKLWMTTFTDDEEARSMWKNEGVDPEHIQIMGMEDNFWTTGGPGPGGPCSEIYVDRGPEFGVEGGPIADENRYIEIWDLVFENYEVDNVKSKTDLHIVGELENKNIDTGAGLERLAYLMQGKNNIYETDEVYPVIEAAERLSGHKYGENEALDVKFRVVADHVRSALMIMSDGVRPSNTGRGYVLRRLLRRTVKAMRALGVQEAVMPTLFPTSKAAMEASYPELNKTFHDVSEAAYGEEDTFLRTLESGTEIFDMAVNKAKESGKDVVSGADAFKLHDTYGFPIELTLEMAEEQGVKVDEAKFRELMAEQKSRARADALKKRHNVDLSVYDDFKKTLVKPIDFLGYTDFSARATVLGIMQEGKGSVPAVTGPANIEVILDRTPFYAEAGGQLADQGEILSDDGAVLEVDDVQKPIKDLIVHQCRLTEGTLVVGTQVNANIDLNRRGAIARSHTATHMVHKALREELGPQATQRGSEDAPNRLRFDFQWSSAPSKQVMSAVEARVNDRLRDNLAVTTKEMKFDDAIALGAMHLFGEKYGDIVRVVSIGEDGWSRELCGGTHVDHVGKIGAINIMSEASVGSGVRRVDAVVGAGAYEYNAREHALVSQLSDKLNARPDELAERVNTLLAKLKESDRRLAAMYEDQLAAMVPQLVEDTRNSAASVKVAVRNVGHFGSFDALRKIVLDVRARLGEDAPVVVALAGVSADDKTMVAVATNAAARDLGIKAGDLVRGASKMLGGGGGGKPDFAQGGGTDASKIDEALKALEAQAVKG
ncbi:MAG: alanine--tRNA ligase [Bifidobacterium merycicum]|uniref:Alanine--tRNA ligase n=1 Tax=Bifidobacterium merycicum TaxID=78345 RepID=A0A087BGY9_9BIFI|nr:alanine--tRNA ligase [Bifidobacterium merycicum]MBQ1512860.1 alanine--tRNA ligase [Bifidobacterium sp.]KFI70289.1 alanyl-tRNA synthetase [Bifidobacterium merycicum]MEE1295077.1 alanine--tRNA ligase [Bifidobacterium merycicum]MEE3341983.1 alanine--tRNA ligase [Bifidobacterium merycicum]SHE53218.1 alanyl-tRNA synthetase [Bifidobacterium merycicum DSM 6492]